MRRLVTLIVALLMALPLSAQRPWGELSSLEQRSAIVSRRTHDVVREAMLSPTPLKELDRQSREKLINRVTARCNDPYVAALYLYVYESLREADGSMAESDVRMLAQHSELVLATWLRDTTNERLYSWAYSLGAHGAKHGQKSVKRALKKLTKKDIFLEYGSVITRFNAVFQGVNNSVHAGRNTFNDVTPLAYLDDVFVACSKEEYESVTMTKQPVVSSVADATDIDSLVRRECMTWDRAYHELVKKHDLGRNIQLIRSQRTDGEYLTIVDANGDSYTIDNEVYMLDLGRFVVIRRQHTPHAIAVGGVMSRGGLVMFGERKLDYGVTILDVKCTEDVVYLHVNIEGKGDGYLNFVIR